MLVPDAVAVEDSDGALHASDGHDGAGLETVDVVAELCRWKELPWLGASGDLLWCGEG